jgi:hypothetical protein
MFKRNLSSDAFDAVSLEKNEMTAPLTSLLKDQNPVLIYGALFFSAVVLTISFLLGAFYFEFKAQIERMTRSYELLVIQTNSVQEELKTEGLRKTHDELSEVESYPHIVYWGTIKVKGVTKALVEINNSRQLVMVGQSIDSSWHIAEIVDDHLISKSGAGAVVKVMREESGS